MNEKPNLPDRGLKESIANYLARLNSSPELFDATPFEIYMAVSSVATGASASTKRKWREALGIGVLG
jgi:hypothetical protein